MTLKQVFDAVAANNANAGGSYIREGQYALMVRGIGLVQSTEDLENVVVTALKGTPVRVRDIGRVGIGHAIRFGVLGRDHDDDLVQGIVLMRKGENPDAVIAGVRAKIHELQKALPAGVAMRPYYSRDRLVRTTVTTVMRNLVEGAGFVMQHAALEVARPLTFAVMIIMTVYVPILTFQRIEGRLFRPMAVTISLAVIGSLVLTLTLIPVLASLLFRRPPSERASPLLRWLRRLYVPALTFCLRRPAVPIRAAGAPPPARLLALPLLR